MKYPDYIIPGDTIGIAAPSAGVGDKIEDFEQSLQVWKQLGYSFQETTSVRTPDQRSASDVVRGEELTSLFMDDRVKMVMCAAGGDFLDEILPYVDFSELQKHPKWLLGASDPTGVLYPYTTKYDVATMYGMNAGSFDLGTDWDYIQNAMDIIQGKKLTETSFPRHMEQAKFMVDTIAYDTDTVWQSTQNNFHVKGRCIGGCIDVMKDLIGTPFEATRNFVERYEEDGQIFYFDNFSMSAENFYRTLKQFTYAGWFQHTKAIILGRVLFPSSETGMSYEDALRLSFPDIPVIFEADIGHTLPPLIMINGAILDLEYHEGSANLNFILE